MHVIDLTGPLQEGMWHYGDPFLPFQQEVIATVASHGFRAAHLDITTHLGTHMDSPKHWWEDRDGTDVMNLDPFIGPGRTLSVKGADTEWAPITVEALKAAGADALKPGDIAVVMTGWHVRWFDEDFAAKTPFLSREATQFLIDKKVRLVATDTALCCDPREGETHVDEGMIIPDHMLLDAGIPYVNGIVPASPLPADGYWFAAFPLKIHMGDGSPVRAVAIVP